jgi:hypothetical protein
MKEPVAATLAALAMLVTPSAGLAKSTNGVAPDSELCRSQLDLLISGKKLTTEEVSMFEAQCDCMAQNEQTKDRDVDRSCAQKR